MRDSSKQDANGVYSILGVTSAGDVRAIQTDEDGNLLVTVNNVILTSSNNTKYSLEVSDAGVLSTTAV